MEMGFSQPRFETFHEVVTSYVTVESLCSNFVDFVDFVTEIY